MIDINTDQINVQVLNNEIKRRVINGIKNELSSTYKDLEIRPINEVTSYKTTYEPCGGGYLEGATHMANVTRPEEKRPAGYALKNNKVFVYDIEPLGKKIGGTKCFSIINSKKILGYEKIPRKGLLKFLGPKKERVFGDIGSLLVTFTTVDGINRLKYHQEDDKLKEACEKVTKEFGIDKEAIEFDEGFDRNENGILYFAY